ncbi:MAG: SIMPL domain-containing protein [Geminicoccaceae bacterium]|jgi:hypothetical protein|nr:SIMPL domain-containing protein [Geminicoccaceae bacterium]MCB9966399.1 SIMPL domain-containing protein [Geminicoccaceae bacterium]HRY22976.1 SIMPL domain-containing protein [Geminicoccaceae bacterium]
MQPVVRLVAAALVGAGLAAAGWFVGEGFRQGRTAERVVTVKGLAEREVRADLALWPMRFVATSDDLAEAQATLARAEAAVLAFLAAGGIQRDAIEVQGIDVTDLLAQAYRSGPVESRYILGENLMVRFADVDAIKALSQDVGKLVEAGVVLTSEGLRGPFYLFTGLNDVKPGMIAEATANARAGAEQFARDSGSAIQGIQRASQGLFQILPRDNAPGQSEELQVTKTVRVVTTIDYRLAD